MLLAHELTQSICDFPFIGLYAYQVQSHSQEL